MPAVVFAPRTDSLFDESINKHSLPDLLTHPGVRLIMPSEESEDYIDGLRYAREFDRARLSRDSAASLAHNVAVASYARVFVNDAAEPYMKHESLRFPAGSLIVREKLVKPHDADPDVISLMLKHDRGFNPLTNDWEFLLVSESKIERGTATTSCAVCHASVRRQDFLFKSYLIGSPAAVPRASR